MLTSPNTTNTTNTTPKKIAFELREIAGLDSVVRERMYELMRAGYRRINRERFESDLERKQMAGLLRDEAGQVQGFTTMALYPLEFRGRPINVLFSGDTFIAPAYWGSQQLVRGFCQTAGRLRARHPDRPLYWLLISKGHRTYLYLPLFTRRYFPAPAPRPELAELVDFCARRLFEESWHPDAGVLRFPESRGELSAELAQSTYDKRENRHVAFFLEKNPGFYRGEELVCLTELDPANLKSVARRNLMLGMTEAGDASIANESDESEDRE